MENNGDSWHDWHKERLGGAGTEDELDDDRVHYFDKDGVEQRVVAKVVPRLVDWGDISDDTLVWCVDDRLVS